MSVNSSKFTELNSENLTIKEYRELAELANIMFREIKDARQALEESEEKYRSYVERANDAIIIVENTLIKYANPIASSVTGYTMKELLNLPFTRFTHPEETEKLMINYNMRMSGLSVPSVFEMRIKHKNGHYITVEVNAGRVLYRGKYADLLIMRDITERRKEEEEKRKREEQIQHTQKLESLGVLAGGIAHDFNNLLMGIMGNVNLLLNGFEGNEESLKRLRSINTSANRAADLTQQLLAYSGKGRFIVKPLNLSELVKEMSKLLNTGINKKADLTCRFASNLPAVEGDATQLRQVIMNLITNASEAMVVEYGKIEIMTGVMWCSSDFFSDAIPSSTLPPGDYVYLQVTDNGCGMDKETIARIFDPFFTTKFIGRGLGLAAVLGIVRSHKGALKVQSELGMGTTFSIYFPASIRPAEKVEKEVRDTGDYKGNGTLLVVDDEPEVLEVVEEILKLSGFNVLIARDGIEAIKVFQEHKDEVRAVILDMTMPNMGGEETFGELRKIRGDLPVIISSGYNEQEVTDHFAGKELAGFIHKPYTIDQMIGTIKKVLLKNNGNAELQSSTGGFNSV